MRRITLDIYVTDSWTKDVNPITAEEIKKYMLGTRSVMFESDIKVIVTGREDNQTPPVEAV